MFVVPQLPVTGAELVKNAERKRTEWVRRGQQLLREREQQLTHHGRKQRGEEAWMQMVIPKFERAQRE